MVKMNINKDFALAREVIDGLFSEDINLILKISLRCRWMSCRDDASAESQFS